MGRRVELPSMPTGDAQQQLEAMYSYLYQMAETLNSNLAEIGGTEFTDREMQIVREVVQRDDTAAQDSMKTAETLKSLIVKTAQFVKSQIDQYNLYLTGSYTAEGKLGKYVRNTKLDVDVTPTGIQQNYSFQEIIQGLKTYEINAKNYIKTGLLRTVNGIPVYGVAIGKDVVTFAEDGTETYNDGNKVAELTADELSFYQGGTKVASYKGNRIGFYYNGAEKFYLSNGKIYCAEDLELASGKKLIINTTNFKIDSSGNVTIKGGGEFSGDLSAAGGSFKGYIGIEKTIDAPGSGTRKAIIEIGERRANPGTTGDDRKVAYSIYESPKETISGNLKYSGIRQKYKDVDTECEGYIDICCMQGVWEKRGASHPTTTFGLIPTDLSASSYGTSLGTPDKPWDYAAIDNIMADSIKTNYINQASSRDVKRNIQEIGEVGQIIDRLRPVSYAYRDDPEKRKRFGLIHEETIDIIPEICGGKAEDKPEAKGINYIDLIPILLKEIQDLRRRVKALEDKEGK